ncbi:MAG: glycosyltransferase family 2 protein [Anaerolineae bacterium]|nr:glycosyltransferase family 2 protein [Anaerolineae bacterium]
MSVVIPLYNAERYLREAVESVLAAPQVAEVLVWLRQHPHSPAERAQLLGWALELALAEQEQRWRGRWGYKRLPHAVQWRLKLLSLASRRAFLWREVTFWQRTLGKKVNGL